MSRGSVPTIQFTLNGKPTEASYEPGMHLLEVLREECGVVSAKNGCAPEGACGCCLVMIDGRPALSCLRKPEQMHGHQIVTLEGIPEETRRVIGEAFVLEGGVQCGFCIPGIVVRAASLIEHGKSGDRDAIAKALDGHLCRCTGYGRIIDAIQTAGEAASHGGQLPEEPRRHHFFGEDFGFSRDPEFARRGGSQSGRLDRASRRVGADTRRKAIRGRHARPRHAARRHGAHEAPACPGVEDSDAKLPGRCRASCGCSPPRT